MELSDNGTPQTQRRPHCAGIEISPLEGPRSSLLGDMIVMAPDKLKVFGVERFVARLDRGEMRLDWGLVDRTATRPPLLNRSDTRPPRGDFDLYDMGPHFLIDEFQSGSFRKWKLTAGYKGTPRDRSVLVPVRTTFEALTAAKEFASSPANYRMTNSRCAFVVLRTENPLPNFVEKLSSFVPVAPVLFTFREAFVGVGKSPLSDEARLEAKALWEWLGDYYDFETQPRYGEFLPYREIKRSANFGQDLFGEEPLLPVTEPKIFGRLKDIEASKDAMRKRIRAIPIWLKLPFFPLWAFAWSYVTAVHAEPWRVKIVGILVPLVVGGLAGAAWVGIIISIAQVLRVGR